jgi:hypothetical protein
VDDQQAEGGDQGGVDGGSGQQQHGAEAGFDRPGREKSFARLDQRRDHAIHGA